jgi:hypothetical protein
MEDVLLKVSNNSVIVTGCYGTYQYNCHDHFHVILGEALAYSQSIEMAKSYATINGIWK